MALLQYASCLDNSNHTGAGRALLPIWTLSCCQSAQKIVRYQNKKDFNPEGFYRTGDVVIQDDHGYLTVVGRKKDQINRGGEKVAPEEVENLLLSHAYVHDASVVGIPNDLLGEKVKAFVILKADADASEVTPFKLKKFLRTKGIAEFKVPDEFEIVEKFPETFVGKVSKKAQRNA